jgi:KDO2-lipid IV(A) lauroyltransferase
LPAPFSTCSGPAAHEETWQQFFTIHLPKLEDEEQARQTGAVWVTPHFGNFELVSMVWGFRGFKFTVVAQDFKNPAITNVFKRLREHSGHDVISAGERHAQAHEGAQAPRTRGFADRPEHRSRPRGGGDQCFGLWTCVPTLHVELAKRLGLSIMTGVCRPLPDGATRFTFTRPSSPARTRDTRELTQRVWNHFEKAIREHPECWLWMYKHWRYRPVGSHGAPHPDYPYYSNLSNALIDMIPPDLRPQDAAPPN